MTWLILILVAALIIGPVAYLKPSPKDKRVVALRAAARQAGLNVSLVRLEDLGAPKHERVNSAGQPREVFREAAAYGLAHELDGVDEGDSLTIYRNQDEVTLPLHNLNPDWVVLFRDRDCSWFQPWQERVLNWAQDLPPEVVAIKLDQRFLACCWRENLAVETGIVATLQEQLSALEKSLSS